MINSVREKAKKFIYRRSSTRRLSFLLKAGGLALIIYLSIAWFILPPHGFWSPDEGEKLLQLQNLRWETGRLAYDIEYTGRQLDPDLQFASGGILQVKDSRLYLERFPLFPLLSLPFFRWLGFYGLYVIPALGGAANQVQEFFLVTLNPSLLEEADQSSDLSQLSPQGRSQLENLLIFHVAIEAKW